MVKEKERELEELKVILVKGDTFDDRKNLNRKITKRTNQRTHYLGRHIISRVRQMNWMR